MAENLAGEFLLNNFTWNFPDGTRVPTEEEIAQALVRLKNETPPDSVQIIGRLVAVNSDGHLDIYLHQGDINDD
jgi:hypothetical protein